MRHCVRATPQSLLVVCWLAACAGDEATSNDSHAEHAGDAAASGAHDADMDDDFQGCPDRFNSQAPGLEVEGQHLAAKVITAMPPEPERYINEWTVELSSLDGSPARGAKIIRGQTFMPVHGHDGGVQPRLTALSEAEQFEVDGLNFTMRGPWEVRLWLRSEASEDDYVVFEVCVAK